MLASTSRNVLKRAHNKTRHAVAEASVAACVHEQRRYASAAQLAVDPTTYSTSSIIPRAKQYSKSDNDNFRVSAHVPISRFNMRLASQLDEHKSINVMHTARHIKQKGLQPNVTTYNYLLDACAKEMRWPEARAVFTDMVAMGVVPNRQTFHHIMKSLAPFEQDQMYGVLHSMEEWGIQPNEITYEIIITRLAEAGRLEIALQYLAQLAPARLSPTLDTATAIVTAAAELGYARLALDLAVSFEAASVRRLEGKTWIDILASCAEALYADGTMRTWRKVVKDLHILPDEGCCLLVLHTAARNGLPTLAVEVLEMLKTLNVVWCEHHIAPVIEAMCHHQQLKEAFMMFDFMRKHDIPPVLETAHPIFELISKDTDSVDNAWGELEIIHEEGRTVDVVALNVVIQAAVALRDLQRAVGTYKASAKLGVKPNLDTFNLLLLSCLDARHRELGDRLLSEMKEAGIRPDVTTYERMVRLCLTQSMYEDAFFYLEEMKTLGMVPPRAVYEALIRKLVSVGDVRYKIALEELKECGYDVTPRLQSFIDSGGAHEGPTSAAAAANTVVL
ncbi:hypothetical protein BD413DRAFT_79128 [Trametes elegans]|nr:hypothetical protein BD413DRAFT_79128 [Trametes elegans]